MLYQVYLVDDEPVALNHISNNISWIENGFQVVGSNTDPVAAVEEIKHLSPHVIFTDVRMPGLNGMELINAVKQDLPQTEFVIISAYSDFPYLRNSIKLNVFDYLLKPVNKSGAEEVFFQLHQKLAKANGSSPDQRTGGSSIHDDIVAYIQTNLNQRHSLQSLSSQFHLSQNTICTYFSKYQGTTFVGYLTELRMRRAQELLSTGKSIKEIAILCGYEDYFYFCRVFQNHFHCTPTQMRKKLAVARPV